MSRRSAANDYVDREESYGGSNHFPTRPVNKGKAEECVGRCSRSPPMRVQGARELSEEGDLD